VVRPGVSRAGTAVGLCAMESVITEHGPLGADQYLCLKSPVDLDAVSNVGRPQDVLAGALKYRRQFRSFGRDVRVDPVPYLPVFSQVGSHGNRGVDGNDTADTAMDGQNPRGGGPQEDFPYTFFGDLFRVESQDPLFRCRVQRNGPQRR